jgi:hypothetical protein
MPVVVTLSAFYEAWSLAQPKTRWNTLNVATLCKRIRAAT